MPMAKCNDINIYYEVKGNGFPLVMIIGLMANVDWWDPRLIEEASKKYKMIMFDNRGAGRTDAPKIEYSIRMFADDTVKLMDNLKIPKAHIFGISMGGMIAQEIAATYPQRIEKLVLCSTNCGGTKQVLASPQVLANLATGAQQTTEELVKNAIPTLFTEDTIKRNPEFIKQYTSRLMKHPATPDGFGRQTRTFLTWDIYDRLPKIKIPTLVMAGKKDILIPPQNAKIIADRIPGAKLVYFDKSAHIIYEDTDKMISTALQFLA